MKPIWVGAPDKMLSGTEASDALLSKNDIKYYNPHVGISKIDKDRWDLAQQYELKGWTKHWLNIKNDRAAEHAARFNHYRNLPSRLGRTIEVGCGPFTQLQTILNGRTAKSITLLDPLIKSYMELQNCPYRTGKLKHFRTYLLPQMAEELTGFAVYDTVICINVLEHVQDALFVMNLMQRALKAGGILIFGERSHDAYDPHHQYDVGHPIRLKKKVLQAYKAQFSVIYENGDYFIGRR